MKSNFLLSSKDIENLKSLKDAWNKLTTKKKWLFGCASVAFIAIFIGGSLAENKSKAQEIAQREQKRQEYCSQIGRTYAKKSAWDDGECVTFQEYNQIYLENLNKQLGLPKPPR